MSRQRKLEPDEIKRIIDRVKAGEYLSQIQRGTGFNTSIIKATAKRSGLVIQKLTDEQISAKAKLNRSKVKPVKAVAVRILPTLEQEMYAKKCNARWFGGWGA